MTVLPPQDDTETQPCKEGHGRQGEKEQREGPREAGGAVLLTLFPPRRDGGRGVAHSALFWGGR